LEGSGGWLRLGSFASDVLGLRKKDKDRGKSDEEKKDRKSG